MAYEVYLPEQIQEICHLLVPGVLHLAYIRVQTPHVNGVSPREAADSLLKVQEVI